MADAVIEGRKKFLSYLSQEGVTPKKEEVVEQPAVLPEEEVKIKEIEEIVEGTTGPVGDADKSAKKGRVKTSGDDKNRIKRKA